VKRLVDQADPSFGTLIELLQGAAPYEASPFAKRSMQSRLSRALAAGTRRGLAWRPALLGVAGLLLAASAAAAGYSLLAPSEPKHEPAVPAPARVPAPSRVTAGGSVAPSPAPVEPAPVVDEALAEPAPAAAPSAKRNGDKPRAGEDPSQVAEAVRALRKQGDSARAQALLDQYLRNNPRGALAEDALALSIEAAAARKDPRAADYARRYLARYPNGRFRAVAERALAR
jgi:hypothetical protein